MVYTLGKNFHKTIQSHQLNLCHHSTNSKDSPAFGQRWKMPLLYYKFFKKKKYIPMNLKLISVHLAKIIKYVPSRHNNFKSYKGNDMSKLKFTVLVNQSLDDFTTIKHSCIFRVKEFFCRKEKYKIFYISLLQRSPECADQQCTLLFQTTCHNFCSKLLNGSCYKVEHSKSHLQGILFQNQNTFCRV